MKTIIASGMLWRLDTHSTLLSRKCEKHMVIGKKRYTSVRKATSEEIELLEKWKYDLISARELEEALN